MRKLWIYTLGVILFGFFSEWLQAVLGTAWFLMLAVTYAVVIRVIAERVGK